MKPRMVLKFEAGDVLQIERCGLHHHAPYRVEHEVAQFPHARLRPQEQIEAAFKCLRLRDMTRGNVSIFIRLARQEQRL